MRKTETEKERLKKHKETIERIKAIDLNQDDARYNRINARHKDRHQMKM
jgi:hypothetical protein